MAPRRTRCNGRKSKGPNLRSDDEMSVPIQSAAGSPKLVIDKVVVKMAAGTVPESLEFRDLGVDGLVELVRDSTDPRKTSLLQYINGRAVIHNTLSYGGKSLVPLELEPTVLEAMRLPTGFSPDSSAEDLMNEISQCVSDYVDIGEEHLRLVSHFVLYTWFQDLIRVAPYLSIIGPFSSGKSTLLALLHSLCRRAINITDFTPAALYTLPSTIMPTLLIDEFDTNSRNGRQRDVLRLLRTGTTQGGHAFRAGRIYRTFCAKVVASRQCPTDAALASRMMIISLLPTRRTVAALDDAGLGDIAQQFQPRLLGYRLQHHREASAHFHAEVPDFTPRMKDLARALAVPLLGNKKLTAELFAALRPQDQEAELSRYSESEWAVAAALYSESHFGGNYLTVGELALTVANVLFENGETCALPPRAVGEVVRSLGLRTEKLGNQGRGFRLTQAFKREVHELAHTMSLRRSDILPWSTVEAGYGGYPCTLCDELGLMVRNDDEPLRCIPVSKRRHGSLYS